MYTGQTGTYTVYAWNFLQGLHQIYDLIRRTHTGLANPCSLCVHALHEDTQVP